MRRLLARFRDEIVVDTATAVPPTNNEREPTLPKPCARSVSPCTTSILSIETPSDAAIICA